jgi:FkbM family methyltransferase
MKQLRSLGKRLPNFIKRDIRSAAFQALDLKWALRSGLEIQVSSQSDWVIYNEIFVNGDYDEPILMAIERTQQGTGLNVLDLGANVGFFILRCFDLLRHRRLGELATNITAVEGNPATFGILHARLSAQNIPCPVNAINGLVGHRKGTGAITDFEICGNNHVVSGGEQGAHTVEYIDLESLPNMRSRINLLKCDIEGGELLFLQNYPELLRRTDVAIFELHDDQCDTKECRRLLFEAGFTNSQDLVRQGVLSLVLAWR